MSYGIKWLILVASLIYSSPLCQDSGLQVTEIQLKGELTLNNWEGSWD